MNLTTKTEKVKVSDLIPGDTVVVRGETKTVGRSSITTAWTGTLLFGEPFRDGVERVLFACWRHGVYAGHVTQP